ncbi:MAG: flagellar export protein FliJ [Bauldia sp.]
MKSRDSVLRLRRFQADEKRRRVSQIESMIAEFERMARDLSDQVTAEQNRTGIHDVTHFAYPTFAKAALARRDNLLASADELKGQLTAAQDDLAEAVEDLKRLELIAERDGVRERAVAAAAEQEEIDAMAARRRVRGEPPAFA